MGNGNGGGTGKTENRDPGNGQGGGSGIKEPLGHVACGSNVVNLPVPPKPRAITSEESAGVVHISLEDDD